MSGGGYEQGSTTEGPWEDQKDYLRDIFSTGRKLSTGKNLEGKDILRGGKGIDFIDEDGNVIKAGSDEASNFTKTWLNSPLAYKFYGYSPERDTLTGVLKGMNQVRGQEAVAPFTQAQTQAQNAILGRAYNNPLNDQAQSNVMNILKGGKYINPYLMNAANIGDTPNMQFANVSGVDVPNVNVGGVNVDLMKPMLGSRMGDLNYVGENELNATARGDYLRGEGNPYLDPMFEAATRQLNRNFTQNIVPGIDSSEELSGRYGSDIWDTQRRNANQDYLQSIGDIAANMYGGAYETERGRMMNAQELGASLGQDTSKTNALLGQEAEKTNVDNFLQQILTQAGISRDINLGQADISRDINLGRANIGRDINLAQAGNIQESNKINSQQDLEKAIQQANLSQQANQFNPEMLQKTEAENLQNQMAMSQYAPQLALQDYEDYARAAAVGEEQRGYEQSLIDQAIKAWEFLNQEPLQRVGNYSNLVSGSYGGTSETSAKSGK